MKSMCIDKLKHTQWYLEEYSQYLEVGNSHCKWQLKKVEPFSKQLANSKFRA